MQAVGLYMSVAGAPCGWVSSWECETLVLRMSGMLLHDALVSVTALYASMGNHDDRWNG